MDFRVPFELQAIPVTPGEGATLPVKVGAVAIGEQEPDFWHRKVEGTEGFHAVGRRNTETAVADGEDQRPGIRVVKRNDVLQADHGLEIEIEARA